MRLFWSGLSLMCPPTKGQLSKGARSGRSRRLKAPAFGGAPHRKGIIYKVTTMPPRKPNSAKRTIAKVRLVYNMKRVFAKIPGMGEHKLQAHSLVFLRGHGPKDSPGINYHLVRGLCDFTFPENFIRRRARSKYGLKSWKKINEGREYIKMLHSKNS
jgi:small subunit ribosomal protein S12